VLLTVIVILEFFCSQQGHEVLSPEAVVSPAAGLLSTTLAVLTGSPVSLDLSCQQWLIQLAGNIFSGMSCLYQESDFIKYSCFLLTVLVELCSMESPS
jgi:hypothetical protein